MVSHKTIHTWVYICVCMYITTYIYTHTYTCVYIHVVTPEGENEFLNNRRTMWPALSY